MRNIFHPVQLQVIVPYKGLKWSYRTIWSGSRVLIRFLKWFRDHFKLAVVAANRSLPKIKPPIGPPGAHSTCILEIGVTIMDRGQLRQCPFRLEGPKDWNHIYNIRSFEIFTLLS